MKNNDKNNNKKIGKTVAMSVVGFALVGVLAIGGGGYIYHGIQVKKEAKMQALAKAEEEKLIAEKMAIANKELEEQIEILKLSNKTTDADAVLKGTENSTNPYGSDELEKKIKAEQKAKADAEQKRIAEQKAKAEKENITQTEPTTQATTQTVEQTTQSTTQATTEPQTEATTQAEPSTPKPNNKPVLGEIDPSVPNGTVKDGMTYVEGFGWVEGTGGSEEEYVGVSSTLSGNQIGH